MKPHPTATTTTPTCKQCGAALTTPTRRTPGFCHIGCQRLAKIEIASLSRQFSGLLADRLTLAQPSVQTSGVGDCYLRSPHAQLVDLNETIRQVEARLRLLLNAAADNP